MGRVFEISWLTHPKELRLGDRQTFVDSSHVTTNVKPRLLMVYPAKSDAVGFYKLQYAHHCRPTLTASLAAPLAPRPPWRDHRRCRDTRPAKTPLRPEACAPAQSTRATFVDGLTD